MKNKKQLNPPSKDEEGNGYVSYSQIGTYKKSKRDYIRQKFLKEPFVGNAYTEQGSKVGEAIENNDFSDFDKDEIVTLKKVPRLDEFERKIKLQLDGVYVLGFIDSNTKDCSHIIDYKQGIIEKKKADYESDDYTQLHIYAAALEQETGVLPTKAEVIIVDRTGNAFKGEKLKVGKEFATVKKDITREKIDKVVAGVQKTAIEISQYYEVFLKLNI